MNYSIYIFKFLRIFTGFSLLFIMKTFIAFYNEKKNIHIFYRHPKHIRHNLTLFSNKEQLGVTKKMLLCKLNAVRSYKQQNIATYNITSKQQQQFILQKKRCHYVQYLNLFSVHSIEGNKMANLCSCQKETFQLIGLPLGSAQMYICKQ